MSEQVHPNGEDNANWHPKTPEANKQLTRVLLRPYEQRVLDGLKANKSEPRGPLTEAQPPDELLVVNAERLFKVYTHPETIEQYERRGLSIENMGDFLDVYEDDATMHRNGLEKEFYDTTGTNEEEAGNILLLLNELDEKIRAVKYLRKLLQTQRRKDSTIKDLVAPSPAEVSKLEDEARGKAAEVEKQALMKSILRAAEGSVVIETTVMAQQGQLRFKDGYDGPSTPTGLTRFGDGSPRGGYREGGRFLPAKDSPEALIFEPTTTPRYETDIQKEKGFFGLARTTENRSYAGEEPSMMTNPITGTEEPAVSVRYQFNGNTGYGYNSETGEKTGFPAYKTPEEYGRSGNYLFVEMTLPQTIANELREIALTDPLVARQLAESILAANGATKESGMVKLPPYNELPAGWTMAVADMQMTGVNGRRRSIVSSVDIEVQ